MLDCKCKYRISNSELDDPTLNYSRYHGIMHDCDVKQKRYLSEHHHAEWSRTNCRASEGSLNLL